MIKFKNYLVSLIKDQSLVKSLSKMARGPDRKFGWGKAINDRMIKFKNY
jgi:hypothetical protein